MKPTEAQLGARPLVGYAALLFLALSWGCAPADPVPLVELPDRAPRPEMGVWDARSIEDSARDATVTIDADAAIDTDADAVIDTDADAVIDTDADASDVGIDAVIDALPLDTPADEIIALPSRDNFWLAWRVGPHLRAARVEEHTVEGVVEDVVGAPIDVGRGEALYAARTSGGHPYLFIPDGPEGLVQMHDLETGEITLLGQEADPEGDVAQTIGLYPPLRLATRGDQLLILGYSQGEALGPLSWQIITRGVPEAPILDHRGLALPQQVTSALEQWVFIYDEGVCLALNSAHALGEHWRCGAFPNARSVGIEQHLYHAGIIENALQLKHGMPNQDRAPFELDPLSEATLEAPPTLTWLQPHTEGPTALIDGRAYLFISSSVHRSAPLPEGAVGLSFYRRAAKALTWGEDRPTLAPLETESLPSPPSIVRPEGCTENIAPEACDEGDADCDGALKAGLCCGFDRDSRSASLEVGWVPRRPFFATSSDVGLIFLMAFEGDEARLMKHATEAANNADVQTMTSWTEIAQILDFDSQRALMIALAERPLLPPVEGEDPAIPTRVLLLFAPAEAGGLPEGMTRPSPCEEPLKVQMINAEGGARLFCADAAVEITSTLEETTPLSYPEGEPLRWITRVESPDNTAALLLVARGEEATLELWRSSAEGITVETLPEALAALQSPEDRAAPIHVPGAGAVTLTRVIAQRLEAWVGGAWLKSPGSSWGVDVKIAMDQGFALSAGFTKDPVTFSGRGFLGLYAHDLRAEGPHWGRQIYTTNNRSDIPEMSYRDFAVVRRPGLDDPALFLLKGDISRPDQADLTLAGYQIDCQ